MSSDYLRSVELQFGTIEKAAVADNDIVNKASLDASSGNPVPASPAGVSAIDVNFSGAGTIAVAPATINTNVLAFDNLGTADPTGALTFDAGNNRVDVSATGYYLVAASVQFAAATPATDEGIVELTLSAFDPSTPASYSSTKYLTYTPLATAGLNYTVSEQTVFYIPAGSRVQVWFGTNDNNTGNVNVDETTSFFYVRRIR